MKIKLEILITLLLLISYIMPIYPIAGYARAFEKYAATAMINPDHFVQDEYASAYLASGNNIIATFIAITNEKSRKVIYFMFLIISFFLLYRFARIFTDELIVACMMLLFSIFSMFNFLSFNTAILSYDFSGLYLASPFILLGFISFFNKRLILWAITSAIAFYMHPGTCLWYLIALFSYIPIAIFDKFFLKRDVLINLPEMMKQIFIFVLIFGILILPRLIQVFSINHVESIIDPQIRLDFYRYGYSGQSSIYLNYLLTSDKTPILIILFSNIILFVLIIHKFWKTATNKLRIILYMYIGSALFLILNEGLITFFGLKFNIVYGLSRSNGYNFIFLIILLSLMIRKSFEEKRICESILWVLFFINFTSIHYQFVSAKIQITLLFLIVILRFSNIRSLWDQNLLTFIEEKSIYLRGYNKGLWGLLVVVILFMGLRHIVRDELVAPFNKKDSLVRAIEFVNKANQDHTVVLYPFHESEKFFYFSKQPGFFNINYFVLFLDLYNHDSAIQAKAYHKFVRLEDTFNIDTLELLKQRKGSYPVAWQSAWENHVDGDFVEEWSQEYNIEYIIREKNFSKLPYEIIFENEDYYVYHRITKKYK